MIPVLPPSTRGFDTELEPSAQAIENHFNEKPQEPAGRDPTNGRIKVRRNPKFKPGVPMRGEGVLTSE